jgi:hypothetical protein
MYHLGELTVDEAKRALEAMGERELGAQLEQPETSH